MNQIKAIGFDLFNTLITAGPGALKDALTRLTGSLAKRGIRPEYEQFKNAYREAALRFIKQAHKQEKETHNRFWISAALKTLGYDIEPDDPRISPAIDAYFSTFLDFCHPITGTLEMLETLKGEYRLGLLSNFTHAPAAEKIIDHMGLRSFFDVVLISGQIGYRKPHPIVFRRLIEALSVDAGEALYVGDDSEADINGALRAGIQPIWFTYARNKKNLLPPGAVSDQVEIEDDNVPEISNWEELFSLQRLSHLTTKFVSISEKNHLDTL